MDPDCNRLTHRHMLPKVIFLTVCLAGRAPLRGDQPAVPADFPRMPPPGIEIPSGRRAELEQGVTQLDQVVAHLETRLQSRPALLNHLPDVQIYLNAVHYALEDGLFYGPEDFGTARKFLREGQQRAQWLSEGRVPWDSATGLVVRGYRSKLDGSVQPYGLVVPDSFRPDSGRRYRLDFWFHGRNNKLSELSFISERETRPGEFTPAGTFVLHPYGRYCNANKFAGEVDAFEALEDVKKHYPIDENRILVRGFSMGGASTWHLATHYAWLWAAAAPGAGFVDTEIFQKLWRKPSPPPWYQQRLWHLYDATDYAANLFNCPVVAYSGEIDGQREAAELMARAMADEGLELAHVIGPNTGHRYEPRAKAEVARLIDDLANQGRNPIPCKIRFTTWTLRYNRMAWVTVDELEAHWQRARVEAQLEGSNRIRLITTNVRALTLVMPAGQLTAQPTVRLDDQPIRGPRLAADGSWIARFRNDQGFWTLAQPDSRRQLKKRHGLQGPIDDAFMDSFLMVRPTGPPLNPVVGDWTKKAMGQALAQWRWQFRGVAPAKSDKEVTDDDVKEHNLVLWGDPQSNLVLARIARKLPLRWTGSTLRLSDKPYSAQDHLPVLIFPNPLNPQRYVVLNSGFTFSDAAPTSNALQVPELPDFAVLDLSANRVAEAGFFDEEWKVPASP